MVHLILHIRSGFLVGGPEKLILDSIARMQKSEYEFVLTTFVLPGIENRLVTEAINRNLNVERIEVRSSFDLSAIVSLRRIMKQRNTSLVVAHDYRAVMLTLLAGIGLSIPAIAVAHGWTSQNFRIKIYERIERIGFRLMDRVVAISKPRYLELRGIGINENRLLCIENGVEIPNEEITKRSTVLKRMLSFPEDSILIGTTGRLSPEKNQHILLKAAVRLRDKHPELRFAVFGTGPLKDALEGEARDLGVNEIFVFPGWWVDMEAVYRGLDIFVLPSLTEGLPMSLLEAMSYGLPSVASAVGGCTDVIDDGTNGFLVQPDDLDGLVSGIDRLVSDPVRTKTVGELARQRILERYSMKSYTEQFLNLYRSLTGRDPEK